MLHNNHLNLLSHLKRFAVASQETCLLALDEERTQNKDKLLYTLRPLVRHKYISRRSDGLYGLLRKGAEQVSHTEHILTVGGDAAGRKRVAEISHMVALLGWYGIPAVTAIPPGGQNGFIPSAVWRTLRSRLTSTTRFLGVLFYNSLRLAVYHIGNGYYEWQMLAECSLHFSRFDERDTRLTGILFVCDNGSGVKVGEKIIRRTLRERDTLLKRSYYQDNKAVRYSRSPIRVRADYKHVYLSEENEITNVLCAAENNEAAFERFIQQHDGRCAGMSECRFAYFPDISQYEGHDHHHLSLSHDLLYLAYFYTSLKRQVAEYADPSRTWHMGYQHEYHIHLPERYAEWGTFLKLPVAVHTLSEEDIKCLTI